MQAFDVLDFLDPLGAVTIVTFFVIGIIIGVLVFAHTTMHAGSAPWGMFLSGTAFFIPYALLRNLQNVPTWERNLGTYVLWSIFCAGIFVGIGLGRRYGRR